MKDFNQQIIKFDYDENFKDHDFYVSKSNEHILKFISNGLDISILSISKALL